MRGDSRCCGVDFVRPVPRDARVLPGEHDGDQRLARARCQSIYRATRGSALGRGCRSGPTPHDVVRRDGVFGGCACSPRPPHCAGAGVFVASHIARMAEIDNIISFDMGGTTAKVGLVQDGEPSIAPHFEVGTTAVVDDHSAAGYPVRTPVIDLVEI